MRAKYTLFCAVVLASIQGISYGQTGDTFAISKYDEFSDEPYTLDASGNANGSAFSDILNLGGGGGVVDIGYGSDGYLYGLIQHNATTSGESGIYRWDGVSSTNLTPLSSFSLVNFETSGDLAISPTGQFAISQSDYFSVAPVVYDLGPGGGTATSAFADVLNQGAPFGVVDIVFGSDGTLYGLLQDGSTNSGVGGIYRWDGVSSSIVTDPAGSISFDEGADLAVSLTGEFAVSRFDDFSDAPVIFGSDGVFSGLAFEDILDLGGAGGIVDIAYGSDGSLYGLMQFGATTSGYNGIYRWDGSSSTRITQEGGIASFADNADLAVRFAAVPEPSGMLILTAASSFVLLRRRRRNEV